MYWSRDRLHWACLGQSGSALHIVIFDDPSQDILHFNLPTRLASHSIDLIIISVIIHWLLYTQFFGALAVQVFTAYYGSTTNSYK